MESFYSVIYYKPNTLLDEYIAVGLFLGGGEGPWLHLSAKRLKLVESVVHRNTYLSLRRNLNALKDKVDHYRASKPDLLLFDPHYSKEQLEELAQQTKGSVFYSMPTVINDWLDESSKKDLIASLLGERVKPKVKRKRPFSLLWKAYCRSKRFNDFERNISLREVNKSSLDSITIHLVNTKAKQLIQGISFDLKKESVQLRIRELGIIVNDAKGYQVTVVHPAPKSNQAKELYEMTKELFPSVSFDVFTKFKK